MATTFSVGLTAAIFLIAAPLLGGMLRRRTPAIKSYGMITDMPQEPKNPPAPPAQDDVEKFLNEQRAIEARRQELIKDLLRQKEAAIKDFDEKLAKLGYEENHRPRRSHHKKQPEEKKS